MKNASISLGLLCALLRNAALAQTSDTTARAREYFTEWQTAARRDAGQLWGQPLYGPLLLADPATRRVVANVPDSVGALRVRGGVYVGRLPEQLNLANTAVRWAGRRWSMVLLPLPANRPERLSLLAHESFHRLQPALGFRLAEPNNAHLDEEAGRVYLRLELAALRQALRARTLARARPHLQAALGFRAARRRPHPAAATAENTLELNEGLAEYTGLRLSGRSAAQLRQHLLADSRNFELQPSFVRSFAYHTVPTYGYLLCTTLPHWNRQVTPRTDLTGFFATALRLRPLTPTALRAAEAAYGGGAIRAQERQREQRRRQQLAAYRQQFQQAPHLTLPLRKMSVAFDPRTAIPLDTAGTVYPTLRISDEWGILTVSQGALLGARWDRVVVASPTDTAAATVAGPGFTLQLQPGWRVSREPGGNYRLRPGAPAK